MKRNQIVIIAGVVVLGIGSWLLIGQTSTTSGSGPSTRSDQATKDQSSVKEPTSPAHRKVTRAASDDNHGMASPRSSQSLKQSDKGQREPAKSTKKRKRPSRSKRKSQSPAESQEEEVDEDEGSGLHFGPLRRG